MKIVQERFDYNEAVDIGLFSDKHEDKHYIVSKNQLKKRCKFNNLNTSHVLHGVLLKKWEKKTFTDILRDKTANWYTDGPTECRQTDKPYDKHTDWSGPEYIKPKDSQTSWQIT